MSALPTANIPHASSASSRTSSQPSKSQRVLACVLCQQRKIRCDRKSPCANCIRSKAQCVPSKQSPRRRRRRFPEQELLDRISRYELLLRQNGVRFSPFHSDGSGAAAASNEHSGTQGDRDFFDDSGQPESTRTSQSPTNSAPVKTTGQFDTKWLWRNILRQSFREPDEESELSHDDAGEDGVKKAWDQTFVDNDNLLLGLHTKTPVELSALHPRPVKIFRLWQIYLNNVDPLLKVTHAPSLQGRVIEAAEDVTKLSPTLEALLFGIYSVSITSLSAEECQNTFGSSKKDLLESYQFGCQQALPNSNYLRTADRECLTAFYLYLVSLGLSTDPRSLSSLLGVAMRIAFRMGIHSESACRRYPIFEAEMRRRLWWSLKLFDNRIGELIGHNTVAPGDNSDCNLPLNVNDSDLRPEMKEPPPIQGSCSDALFIVVRSELSELVRHTKFYSKGAPGTTPNQTPPDLDNSEVAPVETIIEDKYLKSCNPENPLHYMTIWTVRTHLAKSRLVEYYTNHSPTDQTEAQRDTATTHALNFLERDTKTVSSPLTKGYHWQAIFYFPLPAYAHILQDLRKRPVCGHATRAWEAMSDNYEHRVIGRRENYSACPFFDLFSRTLFRVWEAREEALMAGSLSRLSLPLPRIISYILDRREAQRNQDVGVMQPRDHDHGMQLRGNVFDDLSVLPSGVGSFGSLHGGMCPNPIDAVPELFDWTAPGNLNWNLDFGWSL